LIFQALPLVFLLLLFLLAFLLVAELPIPGSLRLGPFFAEVILVLEAFRLAGKGARPEACVVIIASCGEDVPDGVPVE
jgi:hypothetical protein